MATNAGAATARSPPVINVPTAKVIPALAKPFAIASFASCPVASPTPAVKNPPPIPPAKSEAPANSGPYLAQPIAPLIPIDWLPSSPSSQWSLSYPPGSSPPSPLSSATS